MNIKMYLLFTAFILKSVYSKEVIWETSLGTLIGSVRTSLSGHEYYAFEGIPYAKPPLEELRFKAPVPVGPWKGILNATQKASHCLQAKYISNKYPVDTHESNFDIFGSEDCLYLNIYTRKLSKNPTQNILFGILGGSYIIGTTQQIGPDYLSDEEDLIYVNTNFRLQLLGFLSFYDSTLGIPGNAGAKDVVVALQWVHNYIREFGGDPNKVTITGCSSGGQMVNFLMMHPVASKLFRHAISQSGSVLSGFISIGLPNYENLAAQLNYQNDVQNSRAFFHHLNSFSGKDLSLAFVRYQKYLNENVGYHFYHVVIESPLNNPTPFLTDHPDNLIRKGAFAKMPYLTSFTLEEGADDEFNILMITKNYTKLVGRIPTWFSRYLSPDEIHILHEEVKNLYYGNEEPRLENNRHAIEVISDTIHMYPCLLSWRAMASVTNYTMPIYTYFFNYSSPVNIIRNQLKRIPNLLQSYYNFSCVHCDELGYLFDDGVTLSAKYRIDDHDTIRKIKTYKRIIMNFVRTGIPKSQDLDDPTSKLDWKPLRTKNFLEWKYLAIRDPKLELESLKDSIFGGRLKFWSNIFKIYKERCAPHLIYLE